MPSLAEIRYGVNPRIGAPNRCVLPSFYEVDHEPELARAIEVSKALRGLIAVHNQLPAATTNAIKILNQAAADTRSRRASRPPTHSR